MRNTLFILVGFVIAVSSGMGFEVPGPQKRLEAIGATDGLPAVFQRVGFDVVKSYETLEQFHQQAGFAGEAKWLRQRIGKKLGTKKPIAR